MKTLEIMEFKASIEKYIADAIEGGMPAELARYVLKDIYKNVEELAKSEAIKEAQEREDE